MKIAFLAAGNSIHSYRWIKYFVDQGHQVAWISLAPLLPEFAELAARTEFYEIKPSPLVDINGREGMLFLLPAVWRLKGILRRLKPQVLHIHSVGTYGLVGALAGFKPLVLTPWGSDILLNIGFKKRLVKYVVSCGDFFTCDGENTKQALLDLGVMAEKIQLICFGTDVEKFKPVENREEKGVVEVISARGLEPVYDIETLLRAAVIVKKQNSGVKFVIAGGGTLTEKLHQLAGELDLLADGTVNFIGQQTGDQIAILYKKMDIYVSTSLSDSGLSAATSEAMASGLPALVSDSGCNREWVIDGQGGYIFPLSDAETLAKYILELADDVEKRKRFGEYNRQIIVERNNYYKMMARVEEIYKKFIK